MKFNETDNEVIQLLAKLKKAEGGYPVEMMALRRQTYLKQVAGVGVGLGAAGALKNAIKGGGGSVIPPVASTLLETILIVAIVAEAAVVAVINREKIIDLFRTISNQPQVAETVSAPVDGTAFLTELVIPTTVEPTATVVTVTPMETPSPSLLFTTSEPASESEEATPQTVSTPQPPDNNGNQYGLTPKPERTKDPGNNGGGGGGGGNDGGGNDEKPKKDNGK